jgi:hypothetical protein
LWSDGVREATYTGTYEPFAYALPGVISQFPKTADVALLLMRTINAACCLVLLALAAWLLTDKTAGALALLGLVFATTPEVVFLVGVVNASGPEICASVCFFAAILRLSRPAAGNLLVWGSLGLSGTVLAISRPLGPIWVALSLALMIILVGRNKLVEEFRLHQRASALSAAIVAIAIALGISWELAIEPHHPVKIANVLIQVPDSVRMLPQNLKEGIGVFGWLDSYMPAPAYFLWTLAFAGLILTALVCGDRRQRRTIAMLSALVVLAAVAVSAIVLGPIGFALQGRYVMPIAVVLPLYAGEVIYRNRLRVWPNYSSLLLAGTGLIIGSTQFLGWFSNAHRQAVGVAGPWNFLLNSQWLPPLGWLPWVVLVLSGSVALVYATRAQKPIAVQAAAATTELRPVINKGDSPTRGLHVSAMATRMPRWLSLKYRAKNESAKNIST